MVEDKENINWAEYWFSDYRMRTSEEIRIIEEKIKAELLEEAKLFLKLNPSNNQDAKEIANARWEKEYNTHEWQRQQREKESHESNINLLFTEVFNKLLTDSILLLKSREEKAQIREKCNEQFYERINDQIRDEADGIPAISIPFDNAEKMSRLVEDLLIDIEPRLSIKRTITEQSPTPEQILKNQNYQKNSLQIDTDNNGDKNRIQKEINESLNKITCKAKEMINENSKGVKAFLQQELEELIEKYKGDNSTYLSMVKRDFVKHFIWEGINQLGRYKNFEIFWNNVFLKH